MLLKSPNRAKSRIKNNGRQPYLNHIALEVSSHNLVIFLCLALQNQRFTGIVISKLVVFSNISQHTCRAGQTDLSFKIRMVFFIYPALTPSGTGLSGTARTGVILSA